MWFLFIIIIMLSLSYFINVQQSSHIHSPEIVVFLHVQQPWGASLLTELAVNIYVNLWTFIHLKCCGPGFKELEATLGQTRLPAPTLTFQILFMLNFYTENHFCNGYLWTPLENSLFIKSASKVEIEESTCYHSLKMVTFCNSKC